jgi:hypothetical protein
MGDIAMTTNGAAADLVLAANAASLERMQWRADPLADRTAEAIIGRWQTLDADTQFGEAVAMHAEHWQRIRFANTLIAQWETNGQLVDWRAPLADNASAPHREIAATLQTYVRDARTLPDWIDGDRVMRAETIFFEQGVLSCLLLFCASLPECYVAPDLADVLHAAGQLEQHTEHRIRSTAAMIFPVMMRGGLTTPEGGGIAQVLKVRLIHAMIRNLILRGNPESIATAAQSESGSVEIPRLLGRIENAQSNLFETLFAHGWDIDRDALPCNQEELAYTLLTFHYIYLRGMRTLGVPLNADDELSYLHAWNVMAHVLGVERELMPQNMSDAEKMFTEMQSRARADAMKRPGDKDPRPKLGQALMKSMESVIPLQVARGFPSLLTKTLCGAQVASELGIANRASFLSKIFYAVVMLVVRAIDKIVRLFLPNFSLSRMLGRVMGYHLMTKLLLDQTRPLKLPGRLLNQMHGLLDEWSDDAKAPSWMNWIEDRMTARGQWTHSLRRENK